MVFKTKTKKIGQHCMIFYTLANSVSIDTNFRICESTISQFYTKTFRVSACFSKASFIFKEVYTAFTNSMKPKHSLAF